MPQTGLVPFTLADIEGISDWRERLHWPVPNAALCEIGRRVPEEIIGFISEIVDPLERQAAIVAAGFCANEFLGLLELAWTQQSAAELQLEVRGQLQNGHASHSAASLRGFQEYGPFAIQGVPRARLRAIARTATWTPWWRLPGALVAPKAVAISHNMLLTRAAGGSTVAFRHASVILDKARRLSDPKHPPVDTSNHLVDRLLRLTTVLSEPSFRALRRLCQARFGAILGRAVKDILAINKQELPTRIWSGTNGAYATRVIASEVLRRGGEVDGFDHGGVSGISQLSGSTALIELCTTSRFHLATPAWARLLLSTDALSIATPLNRPVVVGDRGDPQFCQAFYDDVRPEPSRPRVVYVGHPYRGLQQFPLVGLADVLYWDFQIHVIEILNTLKIDLVCKPHPGAYFKGQRHPVENLAPTSYDRFENFLRHADAFLFDAPTSTTFFEALCTRARVILIDRGYRLTEAVEPHIRARCRIVLAQPDHRNRYRVDPQDLADAILSPSDVNPHFFRHLAAGV